MKIVLPPPLANPPQRQSFTSDFILLLKNEVRVAWNTIRQRPVKTFIGVVILLLLAISLIGSLGYFAYGALKTMPLQIVQMFLSLLFLGGLTGQIFFGVTAAFAALYMSDDLELLFMAPVPLKVVFAVKSLSVLVSNFLIALLFVFLPGIFFGILFHAGATFYILSVLVGCGLWITGTAIAELINLLVMRVVPPHRSKEAIGFIGALTGILIALLFQLPGLLAGSRGKLNLADWLSGQEQSLRIMDIFPWGWGSLALMKGISGNFLTGLGWSLLLLVVGVFLFMGAFVLLERGFRFITLKEGEGGRRRKPRSQTVNSDKKHPPKNLSYIFSDIFSDQTAYPASLWSGAWAVARKDLLSFKRDAREWFSFLIPLILMAFFAGQYLLSPSVSSRSSLITVLIMYTVMFSGNMALGAFGREGESDWLLNSVPLAGWPVVWGKLLSAVLPTLILMEALLVGTAFALGISLNVIIILVPSVVLLSMGSSAIGLYYSINNCRYNPDRPQVRISPGASLVMYVVNLLFLLFLAFGLCYLFPPAELVSIVKNLPPAAFKGGFRSGIVYGLYYLSRPLLWPAPWRTLVGIMMAGGGWSLIFFGFMAATVRQSKKGFRVELVTGVKKRR
ncbi:MAG: hypothetical protein GX434_18475 [Peptococcaceae bacterium]|nr:hypothetical protein [Peptococcaceae bacterium]